MIYIRTTAYNASKTLERAIKSVLNQTYGEFQYFLVDNGSTDHGKTKEIVEKYAKQDRRIRAYFNKKNHVWDQNREADLLPHQIGAEDYFCLLDADDEYYPTFFEDMLRFMEQNDLDIAACGSDFIQSEDNRQLEQRVLRQDLILYKDRFAYFFPMYHPFVRTIWGKLFKGKTLTNTILDTTSPEMPKVYGNDTFFTIRAFRDAKRAGIFAKPLHRYYMSSKSVSHLFDPDRSKCDRILRKAAMDFLRLYGPISQQNQDFLDGVHANATMDTLIVILNSDISVLDKIKWVKELLDDEGVEAILSNIFPGVINVTLQIQEKTLDWLFEQKECGTAEGAELTADIISILLSDQEAFEYLVKIRNKRTDFISELVRKKWLEHNLFDQPIIKNVSADLAFALPEVIKAVLEKKYEKAYQSFLSYEEVEIDQKDEEAYYLLGQNLAAAVEDADVYIYFKLEWISYLIVHMRTEEAETELNSFQSIMPGDERFQQLRDQLDNKKREKKIYKTDNTCLQGSIPNSV